MPETALPIQKCRAGHRRQHRRNAPSVYLPQYAISTALLVVLTLQQTHISRVVPLVAHHIQHALAKQVRCAIWYWQGMKFAFRIAAVHQFINCRL